MYNHSLWPSKDMCKTISVARGDEGCLKYGLLSRKPRNIRFQATCIRLAWLPLWQAWLLAVPSLHALPHISTFGFINPASIQDGYGYESILRISIPTTPKPIQRNGFCLYQLLENWARLTLHQLSNNGWLARLVIFRFNAVWLFEYILYQPDFRKLPCYRRRWKKNWSRWAVDSSSDSYWDMGMMAVVLSIAG